MESYKGTLLFVALLYNPSKKNPYPDFFSWLSTFVGLGMLQGELEVA